MSGEADAWGIVPAFVDAFGEERAVREETHAALVAAMGGEPGQPAPPDTDAVRVVRTGEAVDVGARAEVRLEDGTSRSVGRVVPGDLPAGYHELRWLDHDDRAPQSLIVSPGVAHLPEDLRIFGPAVQVYALRSADSWGMGDLADLRRVGAWAATAGAGICLVNPLSAVADVTPREPSPYYPTTRRFLDWLYLRVEEVPGAEAAAAQVAAAARAGRALNADRHIDRDAVARHKLGALEAIWERLHAPPAVDDLRPDLRAFATFCALAERHGGSFRSWPTRLRRPDAPAVRAEAERLADRVRFHAWLRLEVRRQLDAAAAALPLLRDLPVGFDPDGFDAWMWQDLLADGVTLGAPPDRLGPQGQRWGLPPFVPWRLRAEAYRPFIATLRAAFRAADAVRIDHILGLFRQFWVPSGADAADGAYVVQPTRELLDIVCLESRRAGCVVVGEDLGTVGPGVRDVLHDRGILRYHVLWFEDEPPRRWSQRSLGSVSTHDLPTVAGVWTGADLDERRALGLDPDRDDLADMRERLVRAGAPSAGSARAAVMAAHRRLGGAASAIVLGQVEDLLAVVERPNIPGTTRAERPVNWSLAYPGGVEAVVTDPSVRAALEALGEHR